MLDGIEVISHSSWIYCLVVCPLCDLVQCNSALLQFTHVTAGYLSAKVTNSFKFKIQLSVDRLSICNLKNSTYTYRYEGKVKSFRLAYNHLMLLMSIKPWAATKSFTIVWR